MASAPRINSSSSSAPSYASGQPGGSSSSEDKPFPQSQKPGAPTPGWKVSDTSARFVGAAAGAMWGLPLGLVAGGFFLKDPRAVLAAGAAGAVFNGVSGWRKGDEKARQISRSESLRNAHDKPVNRSIAEGAFKGALLGAAVIGGVQAARVAYGSRLMGHGVVTTAKTVLQNPAVRGWAAVGVGGGLVLGAASGLFTRDPNTVWGTTAGELYDGKRLRNTGLIGSLAGSFAGFVAYKASKDPKKALQAFGYTTAFATGLFYGGRTFENVMRTGAITQLGVPKRDHAVSAGRIATSGLAGTAIGAATGLAGAALTKNRAAGIALGSLAGLVSGTGIYTARTYAAVN